MSARLPTYLTRSPARPEKAFPEQSVRPQKEYATKRASLPKDPSRKVVLVGPVTKEGALVDNNGARRLARPDQVGADSPDSVRMLRHQELSSK